MPYLCKVTPRPGTKSRPGFACAAGADLCGPRDQIPKSPRLSIPIFTGTTRKLSGMHRALSAGRENEPHSPVTSVDRGISKFLHGLNTPTLCSSENQTSSVEENRTCSLGLVLLPSVLDVAASCRSRISSVPNPGSRHAARLCSPPSRQIMERGSTPIPPWKGGGPTPMQSRFTPKLSSAMSPSRRTSSCPVIAMRMRLPESSRPTWSMSLMWSA